MVVKDSLSRLFTTLLAVVLAISLIPMSPAYAGSAQEEPTTEAGTSQEATASSAEAQMPEATSAVPATASMQGGQVAASERSSVQDDAVEQDGRSALTAVGKQDEAQIAPQEDTLQEQVAAILKDCSATIDHEGSFTAEDTGAHVSVRLSDQVDRCNLTVFAYASNTSFDPDSSQNIRLWSGTVSDGWEADIDFAASTLPLKPGYSVIACLNVPITDDYYRTCNSEAIPVTDENGEGFVDYVYPDAFITDEELEAGATSLHVSVTGDERLFQAAAEGKISLMLSIAQYPDGDKFDFESSDQIMLCSPQSVTSAIDDQEIQLSEPLRAGYRVRAVVYWSQNADLFLVKGNDYESVFHRPDDSLLVNEDTTPNIAFTDQLTTTSKTVPVELGGEIPSGALILVKKFADDEQIASDKGTPIGMAFNAAAGCTEVNLNAGASLEEGDRVVAFVLSGGNPIAQSEVNVVVKKEPVNVEFKSNVTTESTSLIVAVRLTDPALAGVQLNAVQLKKMNANGTTDTDLGSVIVGKYLQEQGEIEFDLSNVSLAAGQKLYLRVMNYDLSLDFFSDSITVADASKDEVILEGSSVSVDADSLTVNVSGCAAFEGGRLIATVGSASEDDPDSRSQLAQTLFTGAGTYTLQIPDNRLKVGQSVMVHLYKYDAEADTTQYLVGNKLPIVQAGTVAVEPTVKIVTSGITSDRNDVWVQANYDQEKVGRLTLYSYEGDSWTAEDQIYSEIIASQESSQRIVFGADKLKSGGKLVAVLTLYGGGAAQEYLSDVVSVAAPPEKQKPVATITSKKVTAGMTTLGASLTFDPSDEATYTLYRFTEDSLDEALAADSAVKLTSGTLYRSQTSWSLYMGTGKIAAGDKLQIVLRAGEVESRSAVMNVEASPDWGQPYVAFGASAVQIGATSVPVSVDYADEYEGMEDFYCDVSIYQVSAAYSDEEIEEKELWENSYATRRVAQVNSTLGQVTRGELDVKLYDWVDLEPGKRLFIKLRLPHAEWEGEEVDYVSASIPVLEEGEELAPVKVLLYNLGEDTARGAQVRSILSDLGVTVETIAAEDLNQTIGYLAGLSNFEKDENASWDGTAPSTEFMLMCGFSELLLDKFLDAMQAEELRIDHKAIVTEYNRYYTLDELIGDIEEEHEVFQALLALDKVIKAAEELEEAIYGQMEGWAAFQEALKAASELLASEEPEAQDLIEARQALIDAGNAITDGQFWEGEAEGPAEPVEPVDPTDPAEPVEPVVPSTPDDAADDDQPAAPSDTPSDNADSSDNASSAARPATGASSATTSGNSSYVASDQQAVDEVDEAMDEASEASEDETTTEAPAADGLLVADDESPLAGNAVEDANSNDLAWIPFAIAAFVAVVGIATVVYRRRAWQK